MPLKMFMLNIPDAPIEKIKKVIDHTMWIFFSGEDCRYEPIFAVLENGDFFPLTQDTSWDNNPIFASLLNAKKENRWDLCMRQTMKMISEGVEAQLDLPEAQRIAKKLSRMAKAGISAKMNTLMFGHVANYLSQIYGELVSAVERENSKRKILSRQLEYYIASTNEDETPFSREAKPHEDYPALRIKGSDPIKTIVCVDVSVFS